MEEIVVIWSSADREVALEMVFMYVHNSMRHGWWDEVTMVVWGPSAKLLANDEELQVWVTTMIEDGVKVDSCRVCTDHYGVSDKLEELGIDVKPMGVVLTDYLKNGANVLTF